jgi:hypothetical protein
MKRGVLRSNRNPPCLMARAETLPLRPTRRSRCAIYAQVYEEGLDQDFNSLDAQRGLCGVYPIPEARTLDGPSPRRPADPV